MNSSEYKTGFETASIIARINAVSSPESTKFRDKKYPGANSRITLEDRHDRAIDRSRVDIDTIRAMSFDTAQFTFYFLYVQSSSPIYYSKQIAARRVVAGIETISVSFAVGDDISDRIKVFVNVCDCSTISLSSNVKAPKYVELDI